ncbi:hypothetical protein T484DRAFT_1749467 [Baffinella frigidus]|nr:hypothetical protein T484DRAFT_1749467 [Cryptophyta sp. CCMP2293]
MLPASDLRLVFLTVVLVIILCVALIDSRMKVYVLVRTDDSTVMGVFRLKEDAVLQDAQWEMENWVEENKIRLTLSHCNDEQHGARDQEDILVPLLARPEKGGFAASIFEQELL